jgi:lipopolysaccharide export LptBFGC system permease protein LptF
MDPKKVCAVINYDIVPQGNNFIITRTNQPANTFSDGVFTYEFKDRNTLSSVSFENKKKTESWKTIIEVNEDGNVSRYLYDKNGKIRQTLLVNYYPDDPRARHKVETITCTFEDDGISYYQQNNTTGKSRSRDRMTLEWTDWR